MPLCIMFKKKFSPNSIAYGEKIFHSQSRNLSLLGVFKVKHKIVNVIISHVRFDHVFKS